MCVSVFVDNFNQYIIAFNQQSSGLLNPYSLETRCPLSVKYEQVKTATFPDEVYTLSLNEQYTTTIQFILANALKSLQNIEHEISNVSFHNLSEGAKRRLACPLLYIYDLATMGKVSDNDQTLSTTAKLLLKEFGTKPVNLDLLVDLQPIARLNPSGPGSGLGVELRLNQKTRTHISISYLSIRIPLNLRISLPGKSGLCDTIRLGFRFGS